jgi:hypothetical protein
LGVVSPTGVVSPVGYQDYVTYQTTVPTALGITVTADTASTPHNTTVTFDPSGLVTQIHNLTVSSSYDTGIEQATGATFNGKDVYRQAWKIGVSGTQVNTDLIATANYVDSIVSYGGYFSTGNGVEKYGIPSGYFIGTNILYAFPLVSATNTLILSSGTPNNRNNADTFIWVEYTKV